MTRRTTQYNVVVDTKEIKKAAFLCPGDNSQGVLLFGPTGTSTQEREIPEGKTGEMYITVEAVTERGDRKAVYQIDCLFHRDKGGHVEFDGTEIIPQKDDLGCKFVIEGWSLPSSPAEYTHIQVYAYGPLSVLLYWSWTIELRFRENKTEESSLEDGVAPRMQISIVGMQEAKKLSWMGLKDGINYVLEPNHYKIENILPFVKSNELWRLRVDKQIGTVSMYDMLYLHVNRYGNGTVWQTSDSIIHFYWLTCTGDYGTGDVTHYADHILYTTNLNGGLQKRVLSYSVTHSGVTFLWGRYDILGWKNYRV